MLIHKYHLNNIYMLLDINSGSVHITDKIVFDIIDNLSILDTCVKLADTCPKNITQVLSSTYDEKDIEDAYHDIFTLYKSNQLFTTECYKIHTHNMETLPIKSACLHVSHDCNMTCSYCFASHGSFCSEKNLMPLDIGKKAIDFIIKNSMNRKNLEVEFFGGEPLLNFDIIKQIVFYARKTEQQYNKNFRFTISTNGTLLHSENIKFINEQMNVVVLSLDGRKEVNDRMRTMLNNKSSYDLIIPKFQQLVNERKNKNYYIRGTITKYNIDFYNDIIHMVDLGFDQISLEPVVTDSSNPYALSHEDLPIIYEQYEKLAIELIRRKKNLDVKNKPFNFFHFSFNLKKGPCIKKRLKGCGSGNEYISITSNGDIYPCHQFVGMDEWKMGNIIDNNLDIEKKTIFKNTSIYTKEDCINCWAKFYCAGGCNANNLIYGGALNKVYKLSCEIKKKRLECAIMLQSIYQLME